MKLNIYAVWPNTNLHACSGYRNYHNSCVAFACLLPFVLKMASKILSWWSFDKQIHTCIFLPSMNTADGGWKCRSTTVSTSSDHRGKQSGSQALQAAWWGICSSSLPVVPRMSQAFLWVPLNSSCSQHCCSSDKGFGLAVPIPAAGLYVLG